MPGLQTLHQSVYAQRMPVGSRQLQETLSLQSRERQFCTAFLLMLCDSILLHSNCAVLASMLQSWFTSVSKHVKPLLVFEEVKAMARQCLYSKQSYECVQLTQLFGEVKVNDS